MKLPVTTTDIQTRYFDTDAMGHISSNAYIQFMELGRADLLTEHAKQATDVPHSVVVNINIDYLSEALFGESLCVISWCSRIGSRSLTINHEIMAGDRSVAKGTTTLVGFDINTRRSCTWPEEWQPSDYSTEL